MGEPGFTQRAAIVLDRLEAGIERIADAAGIDVEIMRTDNVIELEFEDASKIVINSHEAAGEIWVAARSGGYHFRPHPDGRWLDGRSGADLRDTLSRELSVQSGATLDLSGASLSGDGGE